MNVQFLIQTDLFQGIKEEDAEAFLQCLSVFIRKYNKNETIFHTGDVIDNFGLILSGSVNIEMDDVWGNKSILSHIGTGHIFAETYACSFDEPLLVNVVAADPSEIIFFNVSRFLKTCTSSCSYHNRLIQNLLHLSSLKNISLSKRILHTTPKSIRGRLLSYFSEQVRQNNSLQFRIPFNRQQLADYLNVDRSAMSSELSKMQKEGILTYTKSNFCITEDICL